MKKITSHYKRLKFTYIKITILVLFFSTFFAKGYIAFERTGDNFFHVFINGNEVGTVADPESAERLLLSVRREIASRSSELVFMDADLTYTGEEVLWGRVDDERTLKENMREALSGCIKETMHRSYTIKVKEYMVNLASMDEVKSLLQAAISKYDAESRFDVELVHDTDREFNVLTANVVDAVEKKEETDDNPFLEAGVQNVITKRSKIEKPEENKTFEDFDLGLLTMDFPEKVEIVEAYLPENQLKPVAQAIEEVTKEQEKSVLYEVVPGDTLSEIAIKVNIPMDRIVEMNESLEDENSTIRAGEQLVITIPEPELSVERQEQNYYEEIYDEDIIYVDNDSWFTTQTKVLQQPSAGFRKAVAVVSYLNDKEVGREIVKEEIVMEAVAKIVERGTKIPPTYIKPLSGGRQTSGFGKRSRPTRGASTYHKGIDWATPTGTPVVASCGGTVAKAGWGSGYGYVVYINHVDGRQTRYGHLSKVLVKAGQTVKQGERIALSGNTGVSSGPHVHFEMLINGSQVNPLKYLN